VKYGRALGLYRIISQYFVFYHIISIRFSHGRIVPSLFLYLHCPNNVGEGIMLLGHPSIEFVCLFIQTDIITAMSHELLTNLDETYREYSLTLLMT